MNLRDQVFHPYKTKGKVIVLCFLIFPLLDGDEEAENSELIGNKAFPRFNLLLISS